MGGYFISLSVGVYKFILIHLVSIDVRAGGVLGGYSPPKVWATQISWAARALGKASFKDVFKLFLNRYFYLKSELYSQLNLHKTVVVVA